MCSVDVYLDLHGVYDFVGALWTAIGFGTGIGLRPVRPPTGDLRAHVIDICGGPPRRVGRPLYDHRLRCIDEVCRPEMPES